VYFFCRYLCTFLVELVTHADQTKMTLENLATLFAPCLLRSRDSDPTKLIMDVHPCIQVTTTLIAHSPEIFVEVGDQLCMSHCSTVPLCCYFEDSVRTTQPRVQGRRISQKKKKHTHSHTLTLVHLVGSEGNRH
jgi:RhoGAP domain